MDEDLTEGYNVYENENSGLRHTIRPSHIFWSGRAIGNSEKYFRYSISKGDEKLVGCLTSDEQKVLSEVRPLIGNSQVKRIRM